ncbi:ATP-binding protein [uncultured Litoreibacter sp.]|uniref:ATP-binding protein n=1 Tax=uncultured Litoreibacter sp. TaxID=1392394 RepID=UPI002627F8B9|nr:ATP-binding protein [uncultured Litoreibacter sp.]
MQLNANHTPKGVNTDTAHAKRFHFSCEIGGDCLGTMIERVVETAKKTGHYGPTILGNTHLVLAEVVNNIAEHGYGHSDQGNIEITLELSENEITIETTDFGVPMPNEKLPIAVLPDRHVPYDTLPEGGFGWYLIHTLAPGPIYTRLGNANILKFVIPESAP